MQKRSADDSALCPDGLHRRLTKPTDDGLGVLWLVPVGQPIETCDLCGSLVVRLVYLRRTLVVELPVPFDFSDSYAPRHECSPPVPGAS